MAGFDAGAVVSPLDYNFEPYTSAKGRIAEPNDEQIAAFTAGIKRIMVANKDLDLDVDVSDPAAIMAAVESFDPASIVKMMGEMADVYANLCSGKPSVKDLLALPLRVRGAFYSWLQNEVVNPEAGPGAGTAQVTPLRRAAAG